MESKPWNIYWFSQGQKKEQLNRMQEIQFRETSVDIERIKYNTNVIKTESSKNIDLLQVKKRSDRIQQQDSVEQQESAALLLTFSKSLLHMREN